VEEIGTGRTPSAERRIASSPSEFRHGVVRILRSEDGTVGTGARQTRKTAGTGFVVHPDGLIATCAHVISNGDDPPETEVWVEFDTGEQLSGRVDPAWWRPKHRQDVAIVQLDKPLPKTVLPPSAEPGAPPRERRVAALPIGDRLEGRPELLRTFGFPDSKAEEGLPGDCRVVGKTTENGNEVVTAESASGTYGFSGAPVWDPERECAVGMIVSVVPPSKDPRGNQNRLLFFTPIKTIRDLCDKLRFDPACPYRGENVFDENDFDVFFGRDAALSEFDGQIQRRDIVTIVGASGSGKSSLLRAGLAKWHRQVGEPGFTNRKIVRCVASAHPYISLLTALAGNLPLERSKVFETFHLATDLVSAPGQPGASEPADAILSLPPGELAGQLRSLLASPLLIVIDQVERLFTDKAPPALREHFCRFLDCLASFDVKIALGLRLAFREQAGQLPGLGGRLGEGEVVLRPMNDRDLREIVERPAELRLRHFEPSLVDRLIVEARGKESNLPLLQFALEALWEKDKQTGILTVAGYEGLGLRQFGAGIVSGLEGAIVRRAEDVWRGLGSERYAAAERVLLNLCAGAQSVYGEIALSDLTYISRRAWQSEWDDMS
jgi:energy-coupling factor transporter ATP-binding protein EcfA2